MVLFFDRILRAHTARMTQTFLPTKDINALAMDWPVMSEDLESDRDLWDELRRRLRSLQPQP